MAIKLSDASRNGRINAIETDLVTGGIPKLIIYKGSDPLFNATAASIAADVLVTISTADTDMMNAASAGVATKEASAWSATATGTGTPTFFRFYKFDGTTNTIQGTAAVGSGDMNFDGSITSGQTVTINTFTLTDGNDDGV